ncbi:LacI family DNA-binding transcriptional regulator [Euzebya tangerina]|uniref:LacI family DNA-binding transcriptional regulator n=1 Tax=Euzebya tangerina TaxID=591198 RepID=UPI000E3184A1|nr:LacI family DNA-binding transcriptional regulator [Euzebya tangerina]
MPRKPATITEVAALAGVSAPTVSRVLNGNTSVRADLRERVLSAAEGLDYRPSPMARGLRTGRSSTVACIVPFVSNPSAVDHVRGIVEGVRGVDTPLSLYDVERPGDLVAHLDHLDRMRPAGLIVVALHVGSEAVDGFAAANVPLVLLDTTHPGVSSVVLDEHGGADRAARHLVELGHRRVAFIGDDEDNEFGFTSSRERRIGLERGLRELGLQLDPSHVRTGPHSRAVAAAHTTELLLAENPPTAVLAASDTQALGAMDAIRSAGLTVGADVSVIGFDDAAIAADVGLTTIDGQLVAAGQKAARLLARLMTDPASDATTVVLDARLRVRSSTGPPPHDDP